MQLAQPVWFAWSPGPQLCKSWHDYLSNCNMKRKLFLPAGSGAAAQLLPIIEQVKKDGRLIPSVVASGAPGL